MSVVAGPSPNRMGWGRDDDHTRLDIWYNGTKIGYFNSSGLTLSGSVAVGGSTIDNGVITGNLEVTGTVTSDDVLSAAAGLLVPAGRIREVMTPTDVDAQDNTLSAAQILGGVVVHTSATAGGTVTLDTAANIVAGIPLDADGQCVACWYINDGNQTLTFANDGGSTAVVADTGQTIATNESALLLFRRVNATSVVMYMVGA